MTPPMIRRHFVTVGRRQVHYRRAGSGPPILLLHQSPASSEEFVPLMEKWANGFTLLALDRPGYGLSDPLPVDQPEMADYADALGETLDALGIARTALYGVHTGGSVAVEFARRHPERTAVAVANGFVCLTADERRDILARYLPPFVPQWDGSHLAWLWARMRDQSIFFPWYARTLASRMDFDLPGPEVLHARTLDFLRAGDGYRVAYAAAFRHRSDEALRDLRAPTFILASRPDPLFAHLDRLPPVPAGVGVERFDAPAAVLARALEILRSHPAPEPAPPSPAVAAIPGRLVQDFTDVPGGQLRLHRNDDATGRPFVVQHDAAGSIATVAKGTASFIGLRPVVAFDLPGNGESDRLLAPTDVSVEAHADVLAHALEGLGRREVDFLGLRGSGLVGLELARKRPGLVKRLVMTGVPLHDEEEQRELAANPFPSLAPVWYGGHLLLAWHLVRDQSLFWPWFRRTRKGIVWREPHLDPELVHRRTVALLQAADVYAQTYESHFRYPTAERLRALPAPTLFAAPPWDPKHPHTEAAARVAGGPFRELPADASGWGRAVLEALAQRGKE